MSSSDPFNYIGDLYEYVKDHIQDEPKIKLVVNGEGKMGKDNHIEKLGIERKDLSDKISRLKKFMKSDEFKHLDGFDQQLLSLQKSQMKAYLKTLELRLDWED